GDPPRIAQLDAIASQQVDPTLGTPAVTVSGTLRSISGSPLPEQLLLQLTSLDGAPQPMSAPCVRGAFSFPAIPQGTWQLAVQSPGGVQLPVASIAIGNRAHPGGQIAVGDRPLSLVVTANETATRIQGFARKSEVPSDGSLSQGWKAGVPSDGSLSQGWKSGVPSDGSSSQGWKGVAGVMILLVPKDLTSLESLGRRDQSDSDGSFSLRDVVPGQYTVVAIEGGWELDWSRPEVIGRYLPGGIPVTVTSSSGRVLSLSVPIPVQSR
ncbi:MAG: hypothetical protein WBQ94_27675, partial [Terracidiphilus sp.]